MSKETLRYLRNAKEILKKSPIENNVYTDKKPVREAFGTAYLSILEAINVKLIERGFTRKELPQSVESYRKVLKKHFAIKNGKLLNEFESLYDTLHIAGYYRGLIRNTKLVKEALKETEGFIKRLK